MMDVHLEDVERWIKFQHEVNSADLGEVTWLRDGQPVSISESAINDWKFVGLNNLTFAECRLVDSASILRP
jgi:uncharacterized protein YegJ (DUF2314 family)